jgi:hypothetical protein
MSLFGAKTKSTFQKAKERLEKMQEAGKDERSTPGASVASEESSHIGKQLEMMGRGDLDQDGTATTSEIAREEGENESAIVLERGLFNQAARMHNQEAREQGHSSQAVSTVHGGSSVDEEGNWVYKQL